MNEYLWGLHDFTKGPGLIYLILLLVINLYQFHCVHNHVY